MSSTLILLLIKAGLDYLAQQPNTGEISQGQLDELDVKFQAAKEKWKSTPAPPE
jgi:hypothetical protein